MFLKTYKQDINKFSTIEYKILETTEDWNNYFNSNHKFGLMRYEKIRKFDVEDLYTKIRKSKCGFSFDEVHTVMNPKSFIGEYWRNVRPFIDVCWGATATLFSSKLLNIYNIVDFVCPGYLGSERGFKRQYINYTDLWINTSLVVPGIHSYKNLEHLYSKLNALILTYFPTQNIKFNKIYYELETTSIDEYKLISQGIHLNEDEDSYLKRIIDLQFYLNSLPEKQKKFIEVLKKRIYMGTLVYCNYYNSIENVTQILNKLSIPYKVIDGHSKERERKRRKDWFVSSPNEKVLIITDAGGQSLNLQATPNMIFYDIPYGVGKFLQIIGRIVRKFSNYETFFIDFIIGSDTLEDYKMCYLEMFRETIFKIFNCEMIPLGEFDNYNFFIAKKLRNSKLWRR